MHGDVFRAPTNSALLAVYVGTGSQLLGMALVTMVFAVLGFLSPANRGGLMTAMLLLFAFMGIVGGYFSGRLYKRFKVGFTSLKQYNGGHARNKLCFTYLLCIGSNDSHLLFLGQM